MSVAIRRVLSNGLVLTVIGAVLVGVVLGIVLFGGGGPSSSTTAKPGTAQIQISLRRGVYPPLGLALEQPTSWLTATQAGVLTLTSPDAGVASVSISAPAPGGHQTGLRAELGAQIAKLLKPAKVIGRTKGPIGKTPALTTAMIGTASGGRKVLVLSTAVSSRYRTYTIEVLFKVLNPSRQSLLEVQRMLASISFFAPTTG